MIAATEAFPYELLAEPVNQQTRYTCMKTIAEKRKQRAKRINTVMKKLKNMIEECDAQDGKLEQVNIENSVEMGEALLEDVKEKAGVCAEQD